VKVQCPACERLVELERFRLEGDVLVVHCSKCGVESRATAQPAASEAVGNAQQPLSPHPAGPPSSLPRVSLVSSPTASNVVTLKTVATDAVQQASQSAAHAFEVPASVCPKCIARKGAGRACAQCGLVFSAFDERHVQPPEWLAADWVSLLGEWGNDGAHERLRAQASRSGALADLARLYRLRLTVCEDDPWALKAKEEILSLASSVALRPSPPPPSLGDSPRLKLLVVVVMIALSLGALLSILSMVRTH
jgi:Zn ribbon nucleic-acid-binding protein/ribosomal protein L32